MALLPDIGNRRRYRVFHAADCIRDYLEDQLQPAVISGTDDWFDALSLAGSMDADEFRARLCATRLAHPETDHLFSLRAARIRFIPFQLRPVLRLLRSERPRLLVADDVGVGKTIEAGLILKELSTRQTMGNVLVMCPKALTRKWRDEMLRFDEDFRILGSAELDYCLRETHLEGAWPTEYQRSIVHYELARLDQYLNGTEGRKARPGFVTLDPSPQFSLVIADEAHHLRNPGTASHALMSFFCDITEAVVMLTATPLQTHRDDLYNLLHLLRPEVFTDRAFFAEIVEPNRYLTQAIRLLRQGRAAGDDYAAQAAEALQRAADTSWGKKVVSRDSRFVSTKAAVAGRSLAEADRIACIRDLEEVHSLAHVMNRTRRRDIGRFTLRAPQTVQVPFTPAQQHLYDELLEWRRNMLLRDYDPRVVRLILDTLERQAASSLHALAATIEQLLARNGIRLQTATDDPDPEFDDVDTDVPEELLVHAAYLTELARNLPAEDPKLDALVRIASDTMADPDSPGKLLVFSFFLHTIAYIAGKLGDAGLRVGVITGAASEDEREDLRNRFRAPRHAPDALDVLVSSEVGCEGLDYEFCDRLVNYDIPWNPMRIEQRIGRIDRFGQKAEKVLIFNFVTPGTVEERVFHRCFERLGLFSEAIGDLEEILGGVVQDLLQIALDPRLTPQQAEEKARQLADNALRLVEEQRRLESEGADLVGLDLPNDVDELVAKGRFVAAEQLRALVDGFLREATPAARLQESRDGIDVLKTNDTARRDIASRIGGTRRTDSSAVRFLRRLDGNDRVELTFDQDVAAERRDVEFITPSHPLTRAAVTYWESKPDNLAAHLTIQADDISPGLYVFVCDQWERIAIRSEVSLQPFTVRADGALCDISQERLLSLLAEATTAPDPSLAMTEPTIRTSMTALDLAADTARRDAQARLESEHQLNLSRRLASLDNYQTARLERARRELDSATEEKIRRMKTGEVNRIAADYAQRRAELLQRDRVDVVSRRVAVGLLEVTRAR